MGAVDLVIQVATPLSVASGLQRIGRAGHQVGGVSKGLFFPRTRRDLVDSAVIVECMFAGRLENLTPPHNPLYVLCAANRLLLWRDWYASGRSMGHSRVRRAAPWKDLPRRVFDATLDMLSGRYPSGDFSAFRPKLVWNRETGHRPPDLALNCWRLPAAAPFRIVACIACYYPKVKKRPVRGGWVNWMRRWYMSRG